MKPTDMTHNAIESWQLIMHNRRIGWLLAIILILTTLAVNFPTPARILLDPDWALQLVGGFQIRAGDVPFRDFPSVYGPLVYLTSALAQQLSGDRFIAEALLVIVGYAVSYILLYHMSVQATDNVPLALLILLLGLTLIPRMYKYYIVLWPLASLITCWRYIASPSRATALVMALVTAVAGLFRPDFGVYALIAGTTSIALVHWHDRPQLRQRIGLFLGSTLLFASPILLWFLFEGALWTYLYDSSFRALTFTDGLALPLSPFQLDAFFSRNNAFVTSFVLALTIPITLLIVSFSSHLPPTERQTWRVTALWAQLMQFQGFHRTGISHFEQGFTPTLIALAVLFAFALSKTRLANRWRALMLGILGLYTMISFVTGLTHDTWPRLTEKARGFDWSQYSVLLLPIDEMNVVVAATTNHPIHLAGSLIINCTTPQQTIATGPNLINFYYTTQRQFAGRMWVAYPYMLTPQDEQATIAAYEAEGKPAVFAYITGFQYDNRPDRDPFTYLPTLYTYFQENYVVVTKFAALHIAVPRENAAAHPCNTGQLPAPEPIR